MEQLPILVEDLAIRDLISLKYGNMPFAMATTFTGNK